MSQRLFQVFARIDAQVIKKHIRHQSLKAAIFLSLALPVAVLAQAPTLQSTAPATVSPVPVEAREVFESEAPSGPPPVSRREVSDFVKEYKNLQREASQLLKQMAKVKGAEPWRASLNEVVKGAGECLSNISRVSLEEAGEVMEECRGQGLWDAMNEIREEFVPPQEINNVLREIKNQTRDLNRFKKQLVKAAGSVEMVNNLLAQLEVYKNNIVNASGRDQREALQEYWSANFWEEVNKVRAQVELPRELKNISRELAGLSKEAGRKNMQKVYQFFGIDEARLKSAIAGREELIKRVESLVQQGEGEEAFAIMQDEVYNQDGWHPGDVRHFLGLVREGYDRLRGIRDAEIKEQIMAIIAPIVEVFNDGAYREARDALVQFVEQLGRHETLLRPYYRGGERDIDEKTGQALERLESLIQEKLRQGEDEKK